MFLLTQLDPNHKSITLTLIGGEKWASVYRIRESTEEALVEVQADLTLTLTLTLIGGTRRGTS